MPKYLSVSAVICILLYAKRQFSWFENLYMYRMWQKKSNRSYPGIPPLSIWFANVTSFDHTSNCHLQSPRTPQCTRPECIPTLMLTLTSITSLTNLQRNVILKFLFKKNIPFMPVNTRFALLMHNTEMCTYVMASIMSKPIWTQQLAWSGLCSGRPLTQ